jgi:hypothetical protein
MTAGLEAHLLESNYRILSACMIFFTLRSAHEIAQSAPVQCRISSPSCTKHCQQEIIDGVERPAVSPQSPLFERYQGITGPWKDATAAVSLGRPTRL